MRVAVSLYLTLALGVVGAGCTAQQQQQSQTQAKQAEVDAELVVRVEAAIAAQSGVNALHVSATAHNGAVVLNGSVPSAALHTVILSAVRGVKGVTSVTDRTTEKS